MYGLKFLKDDIYRFIPIGVVVINKEGDFITANSTLLNLQEDYSGITNIKQIKDLNDIFISEKKEKIIISSINGKTYSINILELNDLYIMSIIDLSIFIEKYHLLNLSTYNVSNSHLFVLWLKPNGQIIYTNKSIEEFINKYPIKDKFIYDIIPNITKNDWIKIWSELNNNGNNTSIYQYDFDSKKDNNTHVLKVIFNKFKYYNEEYCQMVMTDITELVNLNLKLQLETLKAQESEKLKNAFLNNISHEIRTPMNLIVGFSQLLHDSVGPPLNEYTSIIMTNSDYLLSIIDNIITISRIESEEIHVNITDVSLIELLKNIQIIYNHKIFEKDLDIKFVLDNKKDMIIKSDKHILEEMLNTIVDNAIKFTISGKINIGFRTINGSSVKIYVKDTGIGIENKYHAVIFDRFRQINKVTIGSGLGLAIFKSYVEILKGIYNLKSKLNKGTEVSFTIKKNNI